MFPLCKRSKSCLLDNSLLGLRGRLMHRTVANSLYKVPNGSHISKTAVVKKVSLPKRVHDDM